MSIFISCMYTDKLVEILQNYKHLKKLIMSAPRYNVQKTKVKDLNANGVMTFDVPAYGIHINEALERLFSVKELKDYVADYDLPFSTTSNHDLFFLTKLDKIRGIREAVRINGVDVSKFDEFIKYHENLEAAVKMGKPVVDKMTYYRFLNELFGVRSWTDKLHFSKVLLNFGVSQKVNDELFAAGDEKEQANFKGSVAWISKALTMFKFSGGCIADIVNYIVAAQYNGNDMHIGSDCLSDGMDELELEKNIAKQIKSFANVLDDPKLLWTPDVHFHDCETDDVLTTVLINFVRTKQGKQLVKSVAQLPTDKKSEAIVGRLGKLNIMYFHDVHSENMRVLEKTYKL